MLLIAHKFVKQRCFFCHYSLPTLMAHWVNVFTDWLFYAYVGIHQVSRLVFDNYQTSPVPLIGRWSCEIIIYIKKKHCHRKLCAFRCSILRLQNLILRSRNKIRGKLLLFQKLCYFTGNRFSQCFILPTILHYSLRSKILC